MAYDYADILVAQQQRIAAERAQAFADLEHGRIAEDADQTTQASDRILQLDLQENALRARANSMVASQNRPAPNKYNLSTEEQSVAKTIASNDRSLSEDDRQKIYAEQRHKLREMRSTGQYSDGQGLVFK